MSKWIVDIHGNIEGDYDIVGKFDKVIEDIKAEIEQNIGDNLYKNDGLYHALQIIDKYTLNVTNTQ